MIELQMARRSNTSKLLPLRSYDKILLEFSGGKDSLAAGLDLLERGIEPERIEWWHQHVDGVPGKAMHFMDWPITEDYCRQVAKAFCIPIKFQWRKGGFEREMMRENQATAPVQFELGDGRIAQAGGKSKNLGTRRKFPMKCSNLQLRWCSSSLKIDVASVALNNDPRFHDCKVLIITGERREESTARSKYAEIERHRCNSRKWNRRVDHWRSVINWSEEEVWEIIKRHKVNVHPAYHLGWGRVSCLACIFGDKDQWASVKDLAPEVFGRIMLYEQRFGCTITKDTDVFTQAMSGKSFVKDAPEYLKRLAMSKVYTAPVFIENWQLPKGAYQRCGGPT